MPPGAPRRTVHIPLERVLSKLGLASRMEARELIRAGRAGIETVVTGEELRQAFPGAPVREK